MLSEVANRLTQGGMDTVLNNSLLESIGVHARILLDFLYSDKQRSDDVSAIDYCPVWKAKRPTKSPLLEKLDLRVGKEMAHLTYARLQVTPNLKGWAFKEIAEDIDKIMRHFVSLTSRECLASECIRFRVSAQ
jgi:hypothetical protein